MSLTNDLVWVLVVMWGCGVGTIRGFVNLLVLHYMGLDTYVPTLGLSASFGAVISVMSGPVYGKLKAQIFVFF